MKKLIGLFALILSFQLVQAQAFNQAIGLRGGDLGGLSYKKMVAEQLGYEGIISRANNDIISYTSIVLLYEKHKTAFDSEDWAWHYGGGIRLSSITEKVFNTSASGIGIDAVLGLDYTMLYHAVASLAPLSESPPPALAIIQ